MSKKIYTGVESKARSSKKFYIGVDNLARKVKKMYIGDSEGKARLCYNRIFTWAKYTSKYMSSTTTWGDYGETNDGFDNSINISPSILDTDDFNSNFITRSDDYQQWYITIGTDFTYTKGNGSFHLIGSQEYRIAYRSGDMVFGLSNNTIESELVGKYIKYRYNDTIYKINGHTDTSYLKIGPKYIPGPTTTFYNYKYEYVGDVTSEDENAYTTGSIANYTSSSPSDIRTSYVKK